MRAIVRPATILFLILFLSSNSVWADNYMLVDTYVGPGATHDYWKDADVIGNLNDFDILGLNATVTSDLLKVDIFSTYFDVSSMGKYDTALGDLFISVDGYSGENESWEYAAVLDAHDDSMGGSVYLYSVNAGSILYSQDLTDSSRYIFRSGQEVQLTAAPENAIATGTWGIENNWLSIYIAGQDILPAITDVGFHYAMTCGNDVIEGGVAPVPEPATMVLLGTGLIGLAGISRRKCKKSA